MRKDRLNSFTCVIIKQARRQLACAIYRLDQSVQNRPTRNRGHRGKWPLGAHPPFQAAACRPRSARLLILRCGHSITEGDLTMLDAGEMERELIDGDGYVVLPGV